MTFTDLRQSRPRRRLQVIYCSGCNDGRSLRRLSKTLEVHEIMTLVRFYAALEYAPLTACCQTWA
jgi:hypothetical protein